MADVQIQHADLIATLEAQRNEALNAAAQSGAAVRSLMREMDGLQKRRAELEVELQKAKNRIDDFEVGAFAIGDDSDEPAE